MIKQVDKQSKLGFQNLSLQTHFQSMMETARKIKNQNDKLTVRKNLVSMYVS